MRFRTTMLTSALATLVAAASCSDDSSKKVSPAAAAGAAGAAGEAGEPNQAGGNGGTGAGGMDAGAGASGGAAGTEMAGAAGEGGAPPAPPAPLFLFTVDATSTGLPSSGVAATPNPQSVIFASSTANPDPVTGSNVARISAAELGLADTDTIDAFAVLRRAPSHALYWFSVASAGIDTGQGERPTRLARSSQDGEALGDVYFSDATLSFRSLGESGDELGYNGLVADEQSLGLSPAVPISRHLDDLTGMQLLADGQLPSALYFSVDASSVGLPGSAVEATAEVDRGCTIFKSTLDGQNTVAIGCADLGLDEKSDVKALIVYGVTAPSEALFAVTRESTGLLGSAVATTPNLPSNVFASLLKGTNTLRIEGNAFGLGIDDHLDALAVVDRAPPAFAYTSTCRLTPAPDTAEGAGLSQFQSAHQLGNELILVAGPTPAPAAPIDSVGAYDLKTCAFVAKAPVAPNVLRGHTWAPVPLAGWSAAAPLSNLEYWTLTSDGSAVNRLDSSGALLASYGLVGVTSDAYSGFTLDYDPVDDRFYAVLDPQTGFGDFQRLYFPHPIAGTPTGTNLDNVHTPLPHPCAYSPRFSGVDASGNSVYAQYDTGNNFRVCTLTPTTGEFADLPFTWPLLTQTPNYAVLVPQDALYALFENDSFSVERYLRTR